MFLKTLCCVACLTVSSCGSAEVIKDGPSLATVSPQASRVVKIGDTAVELQVMQFGPGPVFVALHENEATSIAAAQKLLPTVGGTLIVLRHTGQRNVTFSLSGKTYRFDPNRIFTDVGIKHTLGGNPSDEVVSAVRGLAEAVLSAIGGRPVVALHNNTDGDYSLRSYLPGNTYSGDARDIHQVPTQDADDFFFTTDQALFTQAKQDGFNVVLQAVTASDDGSLSVYSVRHGIPYVNVEAEHGHREVQLHMLQWLSQYWH